MVLKWYNMPMLNGSLVVLKCSPTARRIRMASIIKLSLASNPLIPLASDLGTSLKGPLAATAKKKPGKDADLSADSFAVSASTSPRGAEVFADLK